MALWREALLAQAVLSNQTRGYRHHPQLARFRSCMNPSSQIAHYLFAVYDEAVRRGYRFVREKIRNKSEKPQFIPVTCGQLEYEWEHLKTKLKSRDQAAFVRLKSISHPVPHPLFRKVPGKIADWESGAAHSGLKLN